ncbi:MAG: repressor LexA [Verrucomicrobia bacterium]|nr:MAG: repressor LexA [Verrucomicrobiota bacterium]
MLTIRQQQILDFIRNFQAAQGVVPSIVEIQRHFKFRSPTTVTEHLNALEKKGAIQRRPRQARNIRILNMVDSLQSAISIPILGSIPAGMSEKPEGLPENSIAFDKTLLSVTQNSRLFGLDVRGDSMVGVGILDGDIVILEQGPEPRNGDIVAALIDGETTLKRYRIAEGHPVLQSENPAYLDLIPVRELMVQGIYRALIRVSGGKRRAN